jgi:hypothetical protein
VNRDVTSVVPTDCADRAPLLDNNEWLDSGLVGARAARGGLFGRRLGMSGYGTTSWRMMAWLRLFFFSFVEGLG